MQGGRRGGLLRVGDRRRAGGAVCFREGDRRPTNYPRVRIDRKRRWPGPTRSSGARYGQQLADVRAPVRSAKLGEVAD